MQKNLLSRLPLVLIILLISAFWISACGGDSASSESSSSTLPANTPSVVANQQIEVVMNDIWYGDNANPSNTDNVSNPPTWRVKANEEVALQLNNKGSLKHNWAIVKTGAELPAIFNNEQDKEKFFFVSEDVNGSSQQTILFTPPAQGGYQIICTVAGHYPAMQGKLVVE